NYYYHLILWDLRNSEIIGAYRFIPTDEFAMNYDLDKLYSYSLFRYGDKMRYILEYGIELGRSFIQPKYWRRKGLDYLWHGIGAYLAKYPQCRYLFGPVSISGALPFEAKELLVSFYKLHFSPKEQIATSKCPYVVSSENDFAKFGGEDYHENFIYLKSMLTNMGCGVPTLYKQYSELCEQGGVEFIDFGVDPDFNNCIDGLVVVDISKLKPSRYQRYIAPYLQGYTKEAV
ncbi:MAG: GNAT family N-acetyltransferase, partial [Campylobacteraceae bacterium]|nr:GNAT family N-acetyltransferase [Campylobacteraceae bacterium]